MGQTTRLVAIREELKFRCLYDNLCADIESGSIPCSKETMDYIFNLIAQKLEEYEKEQREIYAPCFPFDIWADEVNDNILEVLIHAQYPHMRYVFTRLTPEDINAPNFDGNVLWRIFRIINIRDELKRRCHYDFFLKKYKTIIGEAKYAEEMKALNRVLDLITEKIESCETTEINGYPFPKDPFIYCLMQVQYPQLSYVLSNLTPEEINDSNFDEKILQQLYHAIGRVW